MKRALIAACWVLTMAGGCNDDASTAPGWVSTRGGDGGRDPDGSTDEASGGSRGSPEPPPDAGSATDASGEPDPPGPKPPTIDGVHVSIEREPYETASDVFYFESVRPGIQAELPGATVVIELSDRPGTIDCDDGASIDYAVPAGRLRADAELGSCTIEIVSIGRSPGAKIEANVHAITEHASGEVADMLELDVRVQIAHP